MEQRKILRVVAIGLAACAVMCFAVIKTVRVGKVAVMVKYAPFSAKVEVNGKRVKNGRVNYLKPGEYEARVWQEDFDEEVKWVKIDGERDGYIIGQLVAVNEAGQLVMAKRQRDFRQVEIIAGELAMKSGEEERERYPILKYLPMKNTLFSIGNTYDGDELVVVIRVSDSAYVGAAMRELNQLGPDVNPAEYRIRVEGYEGAFGDER